LVVAFGFAATGYSPAQDQRAAPVIQLVGSDATSRFVPLGVGKSVVIDLPRDIKDVLVADPTIANAVVRSSRRAYIIGAKVGQTNVYFFDVDGHQIGGLDIAVTRDLNGLRAALKQALPSAEIHVEGLGEGLVLSGNVSNPLDAQTAFDIAARLVDDGKKVVNSIIVQGRDQVMLKVTVAEVQRDVIKQLGIDLNGRIGAGTAVVNFNQTNAFSATGSALSNSAITGSFKNVNATLRRSRVFPGRRRVSDSRQLYLRSHKPQLPGAGAIQEVRRWPQLHADRHVRGPHQPQGHDRSVGTVQREFIDADAVDR
jgi:pilus assembly protein CpaC